MEVVEIQQQGNILSGSVANVESNVDLHYGGGGNSEAMAPGFGDDWEE
jgi:hypothetical protein